MAVKAPYRFQMYMDDALREKLREIAYRKRTSMTKLVDDCLVAFVQAEEGREAEATRRQERQSA